MPRSLVEGAVEEADANEHDLQHGREHAQVAAVTLPRRVSGPGSRVAEPSTAPRKQASSTSPQQRVMRPCPHSVRPVRRSRSTPTWVEHYRCLPGAGGGLHALAR
jgi:hypothetical protein